MASRSPSTRIPAATPEETPDDLGATPEETPDDLGEIGETPEAPDTPEITEDDLADLGDAFSLPPAGPLSNLSDAIAALRKIGIQHVPDFLGDVRLIASRIPPEDGELGALARGLVTNALVGFLGARDARDRADVIIPKGEASGEVDAGEPIRDVLAVFRAGSALDTPPAETPAIAGGMAYEGKIALVHAKRGVGKTTIAAWLAARATAEGRKVVVVGDDDPDSWRSRMTDFGAHPDRWWYVSASDAAPNRRLERAIEALDADWVIVDNWRTWALASSIESFNSEDAVAPIAERLRNMARGSLRAVTLLSNEGWHADDRTRGSSALEDVVDVVRRVETKTTTRILKLWTVPNGKCRTGIDRHERLWKLREDDKGFDPLDSADESRELDNAILAFLREHPGGVSQNSVVRAVAGRNERVSARLVVVGLMGTDGRWRERAKSEPAVEVPPLPPGSPSAPEPPYLPPLGGEGGGGNLGADPVGGNLGADEPDERDERDDLDADLDAAVDADLLAVFGSANGSGSRVSEF